MSATCELFATLAPGFSHFASFASDLRLQGIRVNPPGFSFDELEAQLQLVDVPNAPIPLWYDVKGRQLRVESAEHVGDHLEVTLNHPIRVNLSDPKARIVAFKAGADFATIDRIVDNGRRIIFVNGYTHGPAFEVGVGESLHIRHPSLQVLGPLFTNLERQKIELAKHTGFTRYFLSYTEAQSDIDELRELVGTQAELWLKIENENGLRFVGEHFEKKDGLVLVAARGDLYIEMPRPHDILQAVKLIVHMDPEACVGSRILLSIAQRPMPPPEKKRALEEIYKRHDAPNMIELLTAIFHDPTPSCADFSELAWLYEIGYRRYLLCDELCLHKDLLDTAVNAFWAFERGYRI